jgi:hypothetical protein
MVHRPKLPRVVAVLNSNDDLVRLISETLHDEGYLTMRHHIANLRDGHTDITRFFEDRDPRVIIYDLAPPFILNWQFYQLLSAHPSMTGRKVVLTTNNAAALKEICDVDGLQVVGRDDDLRELLRRVAKAFETDSGFPREADARQA